MARSLSPTPAGPSSAAVAPPHHQSKREKRRTAIADKLNTMHDVFDSLQPSHYYAQLIALQCDINLILHANPYHDGPLDDSPEDIRAAVASARERVMQSRPQIVPEAESSFANLAGKAYAEFVEDVNAAVERRDTDQTTVYNTHEEGMNELSRAHAYRVQLAHEEHRILSRTLRDRLIQSVAQKKARLLKDKEQLDIADSNALLLNPSQFSIGNPASPGGLHNPRKTRNTRGRPGEGDEPAALSAAEVNKRKRKAAFDDEGGSPAPALRSAIDGSIPYADAKTKSISTQFEAPLYSIDRLFSEKELTMNINRAHVATIDFFERLRAQGEQSRVHNATVALAAEGPPNGDNSDDKDAADNNANNEDASAQPTVHATRSSNRHNPNGDIVALSGLASLADATQKHQLPQFIASVAAAASKPNTLAPQLPAPSEADIQADLALMRAGASDPRYERIANSCCERLAPGANWTDRAAEMGGPAGEGDVSGLDAVAGAVAMGKSASSMGILGAIPMSKTVSQSGVSDAGVPMRRTASARGGG